MMLRRLGILGVRLELEYIVGGVGIILLIEKDDSIRFQRLFKGGLMQLELYCPKKHRRRRRCGLCIRRAGFPRFG